MSIHKYRNILIRAVNRIGDTINSLPCIKALDKAFPDAQITVLTKLATADLYRENPYIEETLIFEDKGIHKGVRGRLRLSSEFRARHFDLAVIFHNCFDAALSPFFAGIPERIGYVREGRGFLLTRNLPFPDEPIHRTDYFLEILKLIGVTTEDKMP